MKYGIFTKPIHVEKIVNYLNQYTDIDYIISTVKQEMYAYDFDIGVSYCWPWKIDIDYPYDLTMEKTKNGYREINRRTWFNYHPSPLPKYSGFSCYADAINDGVKEYGVTLHRMTDVIDNGEIIEQKTFPLHTLPCNTNELGCITHYWLFQLFKETIETLEKLTI